ncbi:MAG: response regulator, partial [Oxalobacteraceae bacterium]
MTIRKILIVDDSATQRYFLTDILAKNGFSVSTAENGDAALLMIKADKPQLILLDVVMPGKNGFQLTRSIARDPETKDIPIILCTSKDQET